MTNSKPAGLVNLTISLRPESHTRLTGLSAQMNCTVEDLIVAFVEEKLQDLDRLLSQPLNAESSPNNSLPEPTGAGIIRTLLARSEVLEKESIVLGHQVRGMGADLVDLLFALNEKVETLKAGLAVFAEHLLRANVSLPSADPKTDQEIYELLQTLFPVEPLAVTVQERPQ